MRRADLELILLLQKEREESFLRTLNYFDSESKAFKIRDREQKSKYEELIKDLESKNDSLESKNGVLRKENCHLKKEIKNKLLEIENMKLSKFWRLRGKYIYIKNGTNFVVSNPKAFYLKYSHKSRKLSREARDSFKREGLLNVMRRIKNYILSGKGVLGKDNQTLVEVEHYCLGNQRSVKNKSITEGHFLKLGVVPYYLDVIKKYDPSVVSNKPSIAIHLHLFHADMMGDCVKYFTNIPFPFDLYISVKNKTNISLVKDMFKTNIENVENVVVEKVPNRGRDIAPLIVQFGERLSEYDIVSHIHTKKSVHWDKFRGWFSSIMDLIYGSESKIVQIVELLLKDGKIIYPENNINIVLDSTGWSENQEVARNVLDKYTSLKMKDFPFVEFSQGSMFWAKGECVKEFLRLPLKYSDFPKEPIPEDGTLAHALERLLLVFASDHKGRCYRIHEKDSINDFRYYEEQDDFSKKIKHPSVKILAYYLPQFHPTPENNKWHGEGFTEWHKVRTANPLFNGHYQQHIPHDDIGYYLLDSPDVLQKQVDMMKKSGVYGQVFYHYWFDGKLILEKPAQMLLNNKNIAMPFCFCWANENWTKCWDGNEKDVLLGQKYSKQDAVNFIKYLIPFFKDERYIKIENRPVIFIYRPSSIPDFEMYLDAWKKECLKSGIKTPYVIATLTRGTTSPVDYGMDAAVERVLHDWTNGNVPNIKNNFSWYQKVNESVLDYNSVANYYIDKSKSEKVSFTCFRSIVPTWDNTARYGNGSSLLHNSTTEKFQEWIGELVKDAESNLPKDRRFIVVNAWNEWAEGAHLEPDSRFGYGYLNSIGRALSDISFDCDYRVPENRCLLNSKRIDIEFIFTSSALNFLNRNRIARRKFIKCLTGSSIFRLHNVIIKSSDVRKYLEEIGGGVEYSDEGGEAMDATLLFGSIGCFSNDALLQMLDMLVYRKTSVICANCVNGAELDVIDVLDNSSVNSFEATTVRMYPNIDGDYKNYKVCYGAMYSHLIEDSLPENELPIVTTILRFHENANLDFLKKALLSLLSQSGCIVQPLITVQASKNYEVGFLKKLVSQYPWNNKYKPIIELFIPDEKNPDLRSKMINEGFRMARTKYVAVLDYDDSVFPFAYKWLIDRLDKTKKAVSFGRVFVSMFDTKKMQVVERMRVYENGSDYEEFIENNHAPLHSFLVDISKISLENIEYFDDMKYLEDYYLTLQIFTKDNVDWESLRINKYVGDYIHGIDNKNTLAVMESEKKREVLKEELYLKCERRIYDLKEKIKNTNKHENNNNHSL